MAAGSVGSGRGLVQVGGNGRLNAVGIVPAFQGFRGNSHDRLATSWNGPLRAAALDWRTEPATILDRAGRTGLTRCFLQTGPADFHSPPGFSFGEFQVFSFKFQVG